MLTVDEVIELAEKAIEQAKADGAFAMVSSAELCLGDAKKCRDRGQEHFARNWAVRSIKYSVGIYHEYYRRSMPMPIEP